jgi:hypothetical protein
MSKQPRDDANAPSPVLGLRPNSGQQISVSSSPALSAAFHPSTRVITIYSTVDCFVEIGNNSVIANTANSHFVPLGFVFDLALAADLVPANSTKHISVVSTSSGILYISERQ